MEQFQIGDMSKTPNIQALIELDEKMFNFIIKWDSICDCAFLFIQDTDYNQIISGVALVNGLIIRNIAFKNKLMFVNINGDTFEPEIDNIGTEFAFIYG